MRSAYEFVDGFIRAAAELATDMPKADKEDHRLSQGPELDVPEVGRRHCMQSTCSRSLEP